MDSTLVAQIGLWQFSRPYAYDSYDTNARASPVTLVYSSYCFAACMITIRLWQIDNELDEPMPYAWHKRQ